MQLIGRCLGQQVELRVGGGSALSKTLTFTAQGSYVSGE